ncbi:MAG: ATP-dependent helicase [Bacteroidetes bacterium]|nr:MAG: ATP-dependent helicase [Bacteroidota bacterium]
MKFTELKLDTQILDAISYMGYEEATPIQEKTIPAILENRDMIACAQTGTGKTAAFVLPIINKLINKKITDTDTLIIVPTRELAVQIDEQIQGFSYFVSATSIAVYGGGDGKDWDKQKNALINGVDIIVGTPGRLISHLKLGYVKLNHIKHLILDEADRMLDMGFIDDLKVIISFIKTEHQTLMFSATMPNSINQLAKRILHNPIEVSLSVSKPAEGVDHKACLCYDGQKDPLLNHILSERKHYDSFLIFTSTKSKVSEIVRSLNKAGFPAKGISSNLEQVQREEVLTAFKSKRIRILVATDVMSRGIDVKEINMVINYDVPHDAEDYVHRVGRTARSHSTGEALTLVNPRDMHRLRKIEQLIQIVIPKLQPPEELGSGPEWQDRKPRPKNKNRKYKKKHFNKRNSGKKY